MNWNYTNNPSEELISIKYNFGQPVATIRVLFKENPGLDREGKFKYAELTLPNAEFGYDVIVNAIISSEYPSDKMQSVINNYLLDPTEENTKNEFDEMQAFRKLAKEEAKTIMAFDEENKIWPIR